MAGEQFFTAGPNSGLAEVSVMDENGVAASLSFIFFDRVLGKGALEVEGRLALPIKAMMVDNTPVWTPRNGFAQNRPDLYGFVIGRLHEAQRSGEYGITSYEVSGDGLIGPKDIPEDAVL